MKVVNKLALIVIVGALLPIAVQAKSLESAYLDTCRKDSAVPVPVAVVSPSVSSEFVGSTVEVEFTVDMTGKPIDLAVKSSPDRTLALDVMDAVKQWRFMPAHSNGAPVAMKVVLPVKIVDPALEGTPYAVN
jgi:TonB family protein